MKERGRLVDLVRRLRRAAEPTAEAASDASLLERFVGRRDEAAFELLLWRHGPMVLAVCRRMLHGDHDAEDAFQAAFLLLARKAASIRRREAVAGWLYRTACRIALRARQSARQRPAPIPPGAEPAAPDETPDLIWRDLRPVLDEEVCRLPAKYRLPIVLCYFQGRTYAEAAAELRCPKGTVAVRLQRGRELLRGRLTRRGLALSAGALAVLTAERAASSAVAGVLIQGTLRAALLFAAGKAVAGAASVRAVTWTQGVLRAMFLSKLKVLAAVMLTAATATGAGLLLSHGTAAPPRPPADPPTTEKPAPEAAAPKGAPDEPDKEIVKGTTDVSTAREGTLLMVGTDAPAGPGETAETLPPIRVPFLALQIDAKDSNSPVDPKSLPPEDEWIFLRAVPDSRFREAYDKAQLGKFWDDYKKAPGSPIYRRWHEGDPLPSGKVEMAFQYKTFRKLHVGDAVKKGQLLALMDQTVQANDASSKVVKLATAEADYRAAIKTKEEAIRRAASAEFLWEKGKGYIGEDDYHAAILNKDRYIEEEHSKDAARQMAREELSASLDYLKMCEIRSGHQGVIEAIYKRAGETVHNLEPIVRLEVEEAAGTAPTAPIPPTNVPSQRDGVLLVVGREHKTGEKVRADRLLTIKEGGQTKTYVRLKEGDEVEEGQLLARVDDRLARLDVDVEKSKLDAAVADLAAAAKTEEEADHRYQMELKSVASTPEATLSTDKLNAERYAEEVRSKAATVGAAKAQLAAAQTVLEMYEIRSPVRGVVKAILKSRGEAVKSLETVVQIQPKD